MIQWFYFRGGCHAVDVQKTKIQTACGLVPAMPPDETLELEPGTWPPDVCRRCLVIVGSEQTDDEPIEAAKARGYVASRDVKGLAPLPLDAV